jgi:Flp pilus assembly protein TadG
MMRGASRAIRSARLTWQRLLKDERGSVLAFFVAIPVVAGTVAVGVETGQLYRTKRQMQGAADAAALAGAIDRMAGKDNATIAATARYEAQRNGFSNGAGGVTVTVNAPPTSGSNVSATGAVEVIVTKSTSFALAKVLSSSLGNAFTLTSRSVAAQSTVTSTSNQEVTTTTTTSTSSKDGCLVALTTAAEQGVSFTSFNNFTSDCYIYSNGTSTGTSSSTASVYMANFNNATMKSVYTRGSFTTESYNHVYLTNAAQQNQATAIVDPYASLPTPAPGACSYTNFNQSSASSLTVSPGTYCGGMTISSINNVYFTPGIYYVANGDLYITSVNNVTCPTCTTNNGVAIVLTQTTGNNSDIGGVRVSSDNNISLNASSASQTSPPLYAGVLFYQDRRVPNGTMSSTSKIFTISSLNTVTLTGAIYFPNNRIDIASINNASLANNGCTVWIGRYIKFSSYNNNYVAGCASIGVTPPGIITTTTTTSTSTQAVTSSSNRGRVLE